MPFAVLQESDAPIAAEQLAQAFRALPSLTDHDAGVLARRASGIIARRLSLEDAQTLQVALAQHDIPTAVVDQAELVPLPPPYKLRRADCLDDRLVIYDALNRPSEVAWDHVLVVAAGELRTLQDKSETRHRARIGPTGRMRVEAEKTSRTVESFHLRLELLTDADPPRCQIDGQAFIYNYLGPRKTNFAARNFRLLVQDVARLACLAVVNRGLRRLLEGDEQLPRYRDPGVLEEEVIWLFWKFSQAR